MSEAPRHDPRFPYRQRSRVSCKPLAPHGRRITPLASLSKPVELFDIRDAEAFVHATINRARLVLSIDERDELVAEGLAILCKLARDYKPQINGHAQEGRFSGYAAMYLPRKLGDAWHRMHPEHQLRTHNCEQRGCDDDCPRNGRRVYLYGQKSVSLEALTANDPDRFVLMAGRGTESDLEVKVRAAVHILLQQIEDEAVAVSGILGAGGTDADASEILGLPRATIRERVNLIGAAMHLIESGAE